MNIIKQHIRRVLEDTSIAVVPSLGTFTARRRAAYIAADGSLHAPGYDIAFEAYTDGVPAEADSLVASVARALAIEADAARCRIDSDIDLLRQELQLNGYIELSGMGRLYSSDGRLSFEGSNWAGGMLRLDDYMPATLIEAAVSPTEPVEEVSHQAEPAEVAPALQPDRSVFLRSLERTASSAAAIVVLALITFVLAQLPGRKDTVTNATIGIETPSIAMPAAPAQSTPEPALVLIFNTPADGVCDVEPEAAVAAEGAYCLVVASLASKDEAQSLMADKPGLRLLEKDGRFRVYALTGETYAALNNRARAEGYYEQYPSAWICRR